MGLAELGTERALLFVKAIRRQVGRAVESTAAPDIECRRNRMRRVLRDTSKG
jgi:hypothetical protein